MLQNLPSTLSPEERQSMLAAIIDTSDDTIISKTLQGVITSWNKSAERMFGYTEAEAVGQHISLIIPKDRLNEEDLIIRQVSQGTKIDHFETVRLAKSGKEVLISLSVSPIHDANGKVIGASKIARDIADKTVASERQAKLAAIVDSSDDTILSKTLEGIITSWNKAAEKMFGYTEHEIIGKHISTLIPEERIREEDYIIGKIKQGNKVDHFETYRRHKNGKLIPISLSVSPIIIDGQIIGAAKIARDVTVEVEAKKEAERLYQEIKSLNSKKDEFIGLASHELKTPLTSISAYLQILDRVITEEKPKMFLTKTLQQVSKLSSLVNDLLDVSKIESGQLHLTKTHVNIREVLDDAIQLLEHSNTTHRIKVHSDGIQLTINADAHRIEQALVNLMTNAIKYSPKADVIEVSLHHENDQVIIGIKDYGIGISEDKLKHVFGRFYRAEDDPNISGLGIGLYLTHQIIQRHEGKIWAESKPGEGSTFWVSLPAEV
ncbi:PAS domain S-box-containing protein [Daejeonella lutea]|uniref:histidine kinase n=2 Tax=Daejeonella lutea TaxID=572036 RepID=A0A1T5BLV5_9SPHI|nr:PAS domain S-box-containing protein [Daejeonella lutea]